MGFVTPLQGRKVWSNPRGRQHVLKTCNIYNDSKNVSDDEFFKNGTKLWGIIRSIISYKTEEESMDIWIAIKGKITRKE